MKEALTHLIHRDKKAIEYFFYVLLLMGLYGLTYMNVVHPIIIASWVSIPTFGYLYAQTARITDVVIYNKLMYERFGWDPEQYANSWCGILLEPMILIIGYAIGVTLCMDSPIVLTITTIVVLVMTIRKGLWAIKKK